MEHKTFPAFNMKVDEAQGIAEHLIAVFGNTDMGGDVIHPGAFAKTLMERGNGIRVLDQHQTDSVLRTLGKPIKIQEVGRGDLPLEVIQKFPDATGGVKAVTQYNLKTQAGHDAFQHILSGDVNEYSIGYDAIPGGTDFSKVSDLDGTERTVRNLREIRLWEYSPVLWGMNPATTTMSAKSAPGDEAKPWNVFQEGGKWRVYKVDAQGQPTGDALGEFDTEEEARAQVRALYANEPDAGKAVTRSEADGDHPASHYLVVEDPQEPSKWHLRVRDASGKPDHTLMGAAWAALHQGYRGNVYEGPGKQEAIRKLRAMYAAEDMTPPGDEGKADDAPDEVKVGRAIAKRNAARIAQMRTILAELEKEAGLLIDDEDEEDDGAPKKAAPDDSQKSQAGPADMPPTTMDIMALELELSQRIVEG